MMKKPAFVTPTDEVTTLGRLFGTPVVVKGITWLPVAELVAWAVLAWMAGKGRPARPWRERLGVGALTTMVMLGSEYCHNLAHAAAARLVGRPMDALRIVWGMPLVVYYDINDQTVTPRQHILRALGGPLCNALLLLLAWPIRRLTRPGSIAREVANAAVNANAFLCTVSLLPIPGIDGGPLLKWSLVERGYTVAQADEAVQGVNRLLGAGLGAAAGLAFRKRRHVLGAFLAMFAATALAVGFGLLKEQE
jgi:Zn-dependent protease